MQKSKLNEKLSLYGEAHVAILNDEYDKNELINNKSSNASVQIIYVWIF